MVEAHSTPINAPIAQNFDWVYINLIVGYDVARGQDKVAASKFVASNRV